MILPGNLFTASVLLMGIIAALTANGQLLRVTQPLLWNSRLGYAFPGQLSSSAYINKAVLPFQTQLPYSPVGALTVLRQPESSPAKQKLDRSHASPSVATSRIGFNPYIDPRALCYTCSCETDLGCSYNCDKCTPLCLTCDCNTSIGCRYNCDKCDSVSSGGGSSSQQSGGRPSGSGGSSSGSGSSRPGSAGSGSQATGSGGSSGSTVAQDPSDDVGLQEECKQLETSGLCSWGPMCDMIVTSQFLQCNYDCRTCTLAPPVPKCVASGGPAAGQTCVFPFIYDGVKYSGCAPLPSRSRGVSSWCSTMVDVNGYHVRGADGSLGNNVGYCPSSCPVATLWKYV